MFLNKKFFELTDYPLTMVGLFFGALASIVFALSRVERDFYIAAVVHTGYTAFGVGIRAALTKLVEVHETAKSNALIGAIESTFALIFATLYNFIYVLTVEMYAGTFYFMTTASYSIAMVIVFVLYRIYKSVQNSTPKVPAGEMVESGSEKPMENS